MVRSVAAGMSGVIPCPEKVGGLNEADEDDFLIEEGTAEQDVEAVKELPAQPKENAQPDSFRGTIAFGIILYACCSSTLLVLNKVAMHMVPDASFNLFCQFLASSVAVKGLSIAQPEMDIEPLKWEKVKPFAVAALVFFLCLLANTQALKSVNVESVIVVRSCSPIAVCILERVTLGRELPSIQGLVALVAIASGAYIYVAADAGFTIETYGWLIVYFVFIVLEMVYVKFIVDTVAMSTWTRVYYNNTLALPMVAVSGCLGDMAFRNVDWTPGAVAIILVCAAVGVAISYAGFNLRKLISATSFTVVGVVCKLMSVLINDLIWSKHSNVVGHLGLLVCIVAGFIYEKVKSKK